MIDRSVCAGNINAVKVAEAGGASDNWICESTLEKDTLMSRLKICLLSCAVAFAASSAFAGPLNGEPNAYFDGVNTWTSSTTYQGYNDYPLNTDPSDMFGTIDWVVFAPGDFTPGYLGYVPAPNEFVYAYQVLQDPEAGAPAFEPFGRAEAVANNIGTFTGNGVFGVPASASYFVGGPFPSANWDFNPIVNAGQTSVGPGVFSPLGPLLLSGSVLDDGSVGDVIPLPSPDPEYVPEPGTMTLAIADSPCLDSNWSVAAAAGQAIDDLIFFGAFSLRKSLSKQVRLGEIERECNYPTTPPRPEQRREADQLLDVGGELAATELIGIPLLSPTGKWNHAMLLNIMTATRVSLLCSY